MTKDKIAPNRHVITKIVKYFRTRRIYAIATISNSTNTDLIIAFFIELSIFWKSCGHSTFNFAFYFLNLFIILSLI